MNNNKFHVLYCIGMLSATLGVYLLSFLISVIEGNTFNLLTEEGFRWTISKSETIVQESRMLLRIISLLVVTDSIIESNMWNHIKMLVKGQSVREYRERKALIFTQFYIIICYFIVIAAMFIPHSPLMSLKGDLNGSAVMRGAMPIITAIMATAGILYGKISGRFHDLEDTATKITVSIARNSFYFITYIAITWFVGSLYKSGLIGLLNLPNELVRSIIWLIYFVPIIKTIVKRC